MSDPGGSGPPLHAAALVPWANTAVEAEMHGWSGSAVIWHYARLVPSSRTTALDRQFMTGLLDAVPSALDQVSALPVRHVYLACTSAAFMYPQRMQAAIGQANVTLVSAFDAITAVLRQRRTGRVVLLTPYPEKMTRAEAGMFHHAGITVTGYASLNLDDGYGDVAPDQIGVLARTVSDAAMEKAEGIVLSCTGWRTQEVIPELQRHLGKPVISSNLAMVLHARTAREAR
jgi:maleate isomerase